MSTDNKSQAQIPNENGDDELKSSEAPLLEHLTELRDRLIKSIIALAILFILCFFVADQLYDFLLGPFKAAAGGADAVKLIYTAPQEFFFTKLSVAFFAAVFFAFPIVAGQIYMFIAPGLYKNERMAFLPYLIATPICFVIGASLVYYGVLPLALRFFLGMQQGGVGEVSIEMVTKVSEYLSLIMTLLLAFGVCFQLPVVLTLLAQIGLVSVENLKSWRKYAIVVAVIIAAFLTPPDPFSQLGLAIPLIALYEISVFTVGIVERRRLRKEAEYQSSLNE